MANLLVAPLRKDVLWPVLAIYSGRGSWCDVQYLHFKKLVVRLLEPNTANGLPVSFAIERDRRVESYGYSPRAIPSITVGKDKILEKLLQDERLKRHVAWIAQLERPYKFPEIKTISYLEA